MKPPGETQPKSRLALHLGIMLILKLAVLALLWVYLVAPYRMEVDAPAMGQRLIQPSQQSAIKERNQAHDRSDRR